jgi:hypothetical protein
MQLSTKIKLVLIHAVLFGILAFLSFLGALTLYMQFVPEPLSSALGDLNYFAPIVAIGALIFGALQAILNLWLFHKKFTLFWIVNVIIALLLGGLASFFAIWIIWTLITLLNLFLVWFFMILVQREMNKSLKDMPS